MPKFLRNIKQMPEVPDRFHAVPRTLYMSDLHGMTLRDLYGQCPKKKIKHEFSEGTSLKDIIDNIPDNATFNTSQGYYDYREYFFEWEEEESDTQWAHKLNGYNRRLEEYNKWYTDNIDDIQYTIDKQKENKGLEKRLRAEKKKEQLEKELEQLNRILK